MSKNDLTPWGTEKGIKIARWGHLRLIRAWRGELTATGIQGESYVADTEGGPLMWLLGCDCGVEITIAREDFPGRRIARDCNSPDCPHAKARRKRQGNGDLQPSAPGAPLRKRSSSKSHNRSIYLPPGLDNLMIDRANEKGISYSALVVDYCERGLYADMQDEGLIEEGLLETE